MRLLSAHKARRARPARSHRSSYRPRLEVLEDRVVPSNVPPAGITNWWTGDGSADDIIGGRNGALVGGATTGPGLVDQAFVLNGQGAFVNVPDNAALNVGTGNFTVELWVKFNSTSGEQVLAEKYIETDGSSATGWTLTKLSTNVLRLALTDGTDAPIDVDSKTLSIPTNTWIEFAARRSGSTITTFMNGKAVASGTCSYNLSSTASLKLGHRGNPTDTPGSHDSRNFYLNGGIDEAQFYIGTALTNTQIQGIYNDGAAGESKPMAVSRATPAADSIVGTPPTDFAIHFSEAYAAASLQAGDFTVNGIAADSVTSTGANDVTFHYNASPVTAQGLETMQMAAGSVTAADTTLPASYQALEAWTKSFRYDAVPIQVSSTSPAAGGFIILPNATLQVSFNEAYDPNSVGTSNLTLSQGTVTGFTLSADHTSVTYALSGLSEGSVMVSIPAGALTDAYGNPMQVGYSATYGVDIGTAPFPTPLAPLNPAGSLVFQGSASGLINVASDTDTFTLAADPGQTITVLVTPASSGLQPSVQLLDPSSAPLGTATAAAAGQNALLQTTAASSGGTYSIVVGGASSTVGNYTVQVTLNAQLDTSSDGSAPVQSLDGGAIDVEPGPVTIDRAAALGSVEKAVARVTTATAGVTNDLRGSWDQTGASWAINGSGNASSPLNTGVAGSLSRTVTSNAYSFYARSGDLLTLRTWGSSSGGGTLGTALLTLRDPSGVQTAGTAVPGASSDYAITSLTLTKTGTYTVTVSTGNGGKGTYTLTASLVTPANPRPNAADLYSISAIAGQYLSFGAATGDMIVGQPLVQLALYAPGVDPITGTPLATSSPRGTLDALLEYDPATTGSYEVKVTTGPGLTGSSVNYTLVAVSNGSFEANGDDGSFAAAQDISGRPGVVGAQRELTTTLVSASSGGLTEPVGMVFAPDGSLLVSSQSTNSVLRYDATTGAFLNTFVTSGSGGLTSPIYLTFGPDGNLYVSSRDTNSVLRYNRTTGAFVNAFVPSASGGLSIAEGLAFGPDGNLYVTSRGNSSILRYNGTTGAFLGAFVPSGSGGISDPTGIVFGPDGNLYVSSRGNSSVLRYNGTTGAPMGAFVSSGSGGLSSPHGLAFGPDGNLYVSDENSNAVFRYDGTSGAFVDSFVTAGDGGLQHPTGLLFASDGSLLVSSWANNEVLHRGVSADYYQVTLSAGQTVTFSTSTPGDGAGQPVNLLDPHIELYDPTQTLVATGTVLSDGRNEAITYTAPASGIYYVKVSRQNFNEGDYVLDPVETGGDMAPAAVAEPSSAAAPQLANATMDQRGEDVGFLVARLSDPVFPLNPTGAPNVDGDLYLASNGGGHSGTGTDALVSYGMEASDDAANTRAAAIDALFAQAEDSYGVFDDSLALTLS